MSNEVPGGALNLKSQTIAGLRRVGLASATNADGEAVGLEFDAALSLFLPLLGSFDIKLVPLRRADDCPVRFCTGLLERDREAADENRSPVRPLPAGGQGATLRDAALSCLGELAERLSLYTLGATDDRVFQKDVEQSEVGLGSLLGFSQSQEVAVGEGLSGDVEGGGVGTVDWNRFTDLFVKVRRLGAKDTAQLPHYGVLFNAAGVKVGGLPGVASSIGCAVWTDLEGARERAFLELVERDAVAQMWYNRLGITSMEKEVLAAFLPEPFFTFLSGSKRRWNVFHVSTDLPAHVVLAVSHDRDGYGTAFGSAAGWSAASACRSALEEMLQAENSLELMANAYPDGKTPDRGLPRQLRYARQRSVFEDLPMTDMDRATETHLQEEFSYEALVQHCLERNLAVWEFNATRSDLNIPCVKLLSPDLCSWEPRFGKSRLFTGVVERGLRVSEATEAEFAARPFPF
ncbi:YcaO-like family protein [Roseibium aggregatum]|uniref:YcaO-like family protein n=1 Tax=Roseibium aggregatum TaxID=187304 RepID=A0A939IZU1_9HYPH|nr:YcaO-like family protein [Roseibium aggregatum]MBN9670406.1 YcaO-like family protein [Roseibium aggregatum]